MTHLAIERCRFVNDWGDQERCPREAVATGLFCRQHWTRVEAELLRRRRRRYRPAGDVDVLALRARLDDALRQLHLTEALVYYARRGDGLIKIGYSVSVADRMGQLRGEHGTLEVLATEPGGHEVEGVRHREFRSLRVDGEWFRPGRALLAHIDRLQAAQEPLALRVAQEACRG